MSDSGGLANPVCSRNTADIVAGEISSLEEISEQTTKAINVGTLRQNGRIGWRCLSPGITRAKVAREKKPAIAKAVKAKPAQSLQIIPPPAASIPIPGRVLATFTDYAGLQRATRARVDELGFTRETLDHLSGNQPGYSGKLLGGRAVKKFGKHSLGNTLGAVGSYLALVEDPAQLARLKATAEAVAALSKVAGLGMSAAEFEHLARLTMPQQPKAGIASIGDRLAVTGCRLVLIEDEKQTAKMTARASKSRLTKREPVCHLGTTSVVHAPVR